MTDYQKYINALRKCAKEHENDRTSTGHIIVSDLCRDTANLLETVEAIPKEQIDAMIKDIDKIQVYLDCHEGFADEYISKTKLMRIVDKYCGTENNGETDNTK